MISMNTKGPVEMKSPSVGDMPRAAMSTDYEKILKVRTRYQNAWHSKQWEFDQIIETWKFFFGAIGEQWDEEAVRYKTERHMRVAQYNIIRDKVRTMTGMIASDEYDGRFDPVTGKRNSGIEAIEDAYETDKELMDYQNQYWQVILDGIIHVGTMECRYSMDKNPLHGNIAFVRAMPNRWICDPDWVTNDIYDCTWAWKQGHMTPAQILALDDNIKMTPEFEAALKKEKEVGRNWSKKELDDLNNPYPQFLNTYHVVEEHHVEEVKKKRIVAKDSYGQWIPFPITNDNEALENFAMTHGCTDWQNGAQIVPYNDRVAYVTRICPDLFKHTMLADGKPEIQVKGLPICQFTCDKDLLGRNMGIVNDALDPQKDLNYAKSKRQELLASAQGGALLYDKTKLPLDDDQKDLEANSNDVTRAWGVNGDPRTFFARMANTSYPADLIKETDEPFQIVDRILGVSAAADARTQGSNEPASLFAMKLRVNKVGSLPIDKRVKMLRTWEYQSYYLQAQISYSGDERCFTSPDGKKETWLNQRLPDGSIKNKVDELPLCSVTITESESSLSRSTRDRAEIASMLNAIPETYREPIALMIQQAFNTMPTSPELKEKINQAMTLEIVKARIASAMEVSEMIAKTKGGENASMQADIMRVQLEQQMQQILQPMLNPQGGQSPVPEMVSKPPQMGQTSIPRVSPGQTQTLQPQQQNMEAMLNEQT